MSILFSTASVILWAGAHAADLDITGPPARVRFLDAADAEYTVLEGGDGWLNASTQVSAVDFVTAGGQSLEDVGRRQLSSDASCAALHAQNAALLAEVDRLHRKLDLLLPVSNTLYNPDVVGNLSSGLWHGHGYQQGNTYNQMVRYTPDDDAFTDGDELDIPRLPWAVHSSAPVWCNSTLYVLGGLGGFHAWPAPDRNAWTRIVYKYTNGIGWERLADMPITWALNRPDFVAHCVDDVRIYIMRAERNSHRVYQYDIASNTWSLDSYRHASSSPPRLFDSHFFFGTHAGLGNVLYAFGGYGQSSYSKAWSLKYDTSSGAWTQITDLPAPRTYAGVQVHGGSLYIMGGGCNQACGSGWNWYKTTYRYDPASNSYATLAPLPSNMRGQNTMPSASYGGYIFITLARNDEAAYRDPKVYRYNPSANSWTIHSQGYVRTGTGTEDAQYSNLRLVAIP